MRTFFSNKTWIAVQSFFFVIGIIAAIEFENWMGYKMGAIGAAFNIISQPDNLAPAIFLIIFSDLAFNTEVLEGTLITHVLMGKSQREWFLRRFSLFTLFIVIQFFLFAFFMGLGDFLVTWHLFNVIPESVKHLSKATNVIPLVLIKGVAIELLKSLGFVSLAVFVSTLFPGRLFIGPAVSIGGFLIGGKIAGSFAKENKTFAGILDKILMTNFDKSWWVAVIFIAVFWLLSYLRIERIKLTNQGV